MPEPASTATRRLPSNRPATVAILGHGQMGLVCAGLLCAQDRARGAGELPTPRVLMWGHDAGHAGRLAQSRRSDHLEGFELPDEVSIVIDDARIAEADLIVCAIPAQFIREVFERLRPHVAESALIVSVAKGIENRTLLRPTQIIRDVLTGEPDDHTRAVGVLSGPTIAAELARGLPATMIAADNGSDLAPELQRLFSTSWLRVYTLADMHGVELAGATKNVIALAAGMLDGLQAGNNAKSALLARGLAEITRLGAALGADRETFFGVAGVGDLATTCFSPEGRNRSCGEALGRGQTLDEYLAGSPYVVEGVATTRSVMDLAARQGVEMPITEAVAAVLFEGLDPLEAITRLMSRELKAERIG